MAGEYGAQAVFLEQNVNALIGLRINRFWAAFSGGTAYYPMVMVDSGNQVADRMKSGTDWHTAYKAMVDAELARPPRAEITAAATRVGNHYQFQVQVKNTSGVDLSTSNGATLALIVYEDVPPGVTSEKVTGRVVRAVAQRSITLSNNSSAVYTLDSTDLSGVNWGSLHSIALVDYRPGGSSGKYEMLQAAVATTQPTMRTFLPLIVK